MAYQLSDVKSSVLTLASDLSLNSSSATSELYELRKVSELF